MTWWHPASARRRGIGRLRFGLRESELPLNQDERHATWLELFFDLVFVLALATVQNRLRASSPHLGELVTTFGLYAVVWLAWLGQAFYDTRFDPDDIIHRLAVLVGMVGAGAMALGAASAPDTLLLPVGYIVVRGILIVFYLRVRHSTPVTHQLTTVYLTGFGTGLLVWIASLAVPVHMRPLPWAIAFGIEFLTPWLGRPWVAQIPVDPTHMPERLGQFTIILLGTSLTDLRDAIAPRPEADVIVAAAIAVCAIPPVTAIAILVTDPITLLSLLAAVLIGYAIAVSRHIVHLGRSRTTGP